MKTQNYLGFEIQKQDGGGFRILENGADVAGWCPNYKTAIHWIEEIISERESN